MAGERLTPVDALRLWYGICGHEERDRVVAFANAMADHYLTAPPARERILISTLDIPSMAYGALRRAGYQFVDEIDSLSTHELQTLRHIGPLSALAIRAAINKRLRRVCQ